MTCKEMAVKHNVSYDVMRKTVSDHKIADPKIALMHEDRDRAVKYRVKYRWFIHEIAEQLNRNACWVRRVLREARCTMVEQLKIVFSRARTCVQLPLFGDVQLSLFGEPLMMAA